MSTSEITDKLKGPITDVINEDVEDENDENEDETAPDVAVNGGQQTCLNVTIYRSLYY